MKSIAFYNNKGGVGKTTSAINVSYELAKNSKVLIIDVDGQANCSRFFTEELKSGLEQALVSSEVSPETALCHTRYDNIDIITATKELNSIATLFGHLTDEEQTSYARRIIAYGSDYDYVLLDLPPALTKVTERLIGACDVVFIPIELGTFAIQGIPTVTGMVKKCGAKFGGCIINKYDKKNSADAQLLELLNETLGNKTLKSKIPFSRVIKNSISGGKFNAKSNPSLICQVLFCVELTAGEYMGWTNAAKSYAELAAEIRERV